MSTCPACKTAMKPLFTGFYCPKDCDKKTAETSRGMSYALVRRNWVDEFSFGMFRARAGGWWSPEHICSTQDATIRHIKNQFPDDKTEWLMLACGIDRDAIEPWYGSAAFTETPYPNAVWTLLRKVNIS